MNRTIGEWLHTLNNMCEGTEYEAIENGAKDSAAGVAIVPKNIHTPQKILIIPRKTKGASIAIEMDVYHRIKEIEGINKPCREKGNRPHYKDVSDEVIEDICKVFLGKK